jgi:ABC-type iron transport system FetAB permease component
LENYKAKEMEQEKLKVEESLNIISEMISATKYNISQDKVIYLMWGYAVAISAMAHYLLQYQFGVENAWLVWLTMPIAGIYNGIYFSRKKKDAKVISFTDRALASIWKTFIAALYFGFEIQLFLLSLSVIFSFIIPGHLLPKELKV